MTVCPAKTQISLGICPVWSESSLCAQWVAKDRSSLCADSEDPAQTGWLPRLIWVFAGRTVILFVLSCRGSYSKKRVCWVYTVRYFIVTFLFCDFVIVNCPRIFKFVMHIFLCKFYAFKCVAWMLNFQTSKFANITENKVLGNNSEFTVVRRIIICITWF